MSEVTSSRQRLGAGSLLRTVLYAPGNHPRRLDKAFTVGADAVVLDLEDAVPPQEKLKARELVGARLQAARPPGGPWAIARINPQPTGLAAEDLAAVVGPGTDAVMLPKADSVADIKWLEGELTRLEIERGLRPGQIAIMPMIETALGVLEARRIAAAAQRVITLAFGSLDFVQDIGTGLSRAGEELLLARSTLVLACRAVGVGPPIDGVYPHLDDEAGLVAETQRVRQLGFGGKTLLHPAQVAPVARAFAPTPAEVDYARQVVAAFAQAEAQGQGVLRVGDRFVDRPVVLWARRVLAATDGAAPTA